MEYERDRLLYFCNLLPFHSLTVLHLNCFEPEKVHSIQPLCCRELIFTEEDVLVAPAYGSEKDLLMVIQVSKYKEEDFLDKLKKMSLKIKEQLQITTEIFQYCLSFTMIQRLAPLWNKVGDYLIQGKDFLISCEKLNAVYPEIYVTDKICLKLEALLLRMPPCKLSTFLPESQIASFFERKEETVVRGSLLLSEMCVVLPSLKLRNLCSISRSIPKNSPFASYSELRQHWKLMYGYRLPVEEPHFYGNISFGGENVFTYPSYCIREYVPVQFNRCDPNMTVSCFMTDILRRLPSICKHEVRFTSHPLVVSKDLMPASRGENSCLSKVASDHHNKATAPFLCQYQTKQQPLETASVTSVDRQHEKRYVPIFTSTFAKKQAKGGRALTVLRNPTNNPRSEASETELTVHSSLDHAVELVSGVLDRKLANDTPTSQKARLVPRWLHKSGQRKVDSSQKSSIFDTSTAGKARNLTKSSTKCKTNLIKLTNKDQNGNLLQRGHKENVCALKKTGKDRRLSFTAKDQIQLNETGHDTVNVNPYGLHCVERVEKTNTMPSSTILRYQKIENDLSTLRGLEIARQVMETASLDKNGQDIWKTKRKFCFDELAVFSETDGNSRKMKKSETKSVDSEMKKAYQEGKLNKLTTSTIRGWLRENGVKAKAGEKKEELLRKVEEYMVLH